ncbi:MAG: Mut7-C RNAse domain-containing protein [Candidatus Lokiarchaeota archaeon]
MDESGRKFLVDAMLGKLTRFLRIFGYDTIYANDLEIIYNIKPIPDEMLLEYAKENKRIIITRDYPFYKKIQDQSVYLEGRGITNYLKQLKQKLDLNYEFQIKKARCSICNSEIKRIPRSKAKKYIKPKILDYVDEFYQCKNPDCQKIFWKGSHIEDIMKKLKEIKE